MKKSAIILQLVLTFMKIGAFTFGGGYAMISILENEFVEKKKWLEKEEFLDMVAIAESTPGPIAINCATYIGYKTAGILGSAAATLAVSLPSFVIIFIISLFFDRFLELKFVGYAFKGIQACVVYLIAAAGIKMFKGIKKTAFSITVFTAVAVAFTVMTLTATTFSTVFYILICGVLGIAVYLIKEIGKRGKKE